MIDIDKLIPRITDVKALNRILELEQAQRDAQRHENIEAGYSEDGQSVDDWHDELTADYHRSIL